MIIALNIQTAISDKNTLEKNQRIYDTFCCLYEAYHHLMFVLLTYQHDQGKPFYSYEDYKKSMNDIDQVRLPKYVEGMTEHIVTKSGVDAVTKALLAVQLQPQQSQTSIGKSPYIIEICRENSKVEQIYFEIQESIVTLFTEKLPITTILSGISCAKYSPKGEYRTNEIIKYATKQEPVFLILDSTVQLPDSELDPIYIILNNQAIQKKLKDGTLVIFLVKSFQKFATLGTQKMRAGNLSVISNKESELAKTALKILREKFDDLFTPTTWGAELQWMTQILTYNSSHELDFLKECNNSVTQFRRTDRMNFTDSFSMLLLKQDSAKKLPITVFPEGMASFGYAFSLATSYSAPFSTRLNLGLEPTILLNQLKEAFEKGEGYYGAWTENNNLLFLERGYIESLASAVEQFAKYSNLGRVPGNSASELYTTAQKIISRRIIKSLDEDTIIFWDFENFQEKTAITKEEIEEIIVKTQELGQELSDKSILETLRNCVEFGLKQNKKIEDMIQEIENLIDEEMDKKLKVRGRKDYSILREIEEFLKEYKKSKRIEIMKNPSGFLFSPISYYLINRLLRYDHDHEKLRLYMSERVKKYREALTLLKPDSAEHLELNEKLNDLIRYASG
jgi:hypothetical protein